MPLAAALRRYELAVHAAGGLDGPAPPGPAGLELARARVALVAELQRDGWEPDPRVLALLKRDRVRVAQATNADAGCRSGAVDGGRTARVAGEPGEDLGLAEHPAPVVPPD